LFDRGYGDFHVIGFSLGGQISGAIGRYVIQKSKGRYKIPRITGLDPGMIPPGFQGIIKDLNAGDATFVDTIHGETKFFGSGTSLGDASFWVNGGILQPSCQAPLFISKSTNLFQNLSMKSRLNFQSLQSAVI
jgi:pancreatic lipase-related protein 2